MRYEEPPSDMTYKEIMDNINDFCKKSKKSGIKEEYCPLFCVLRGKKTCMREIVTAAVVATKDDFANKVVREMLEVENYFNELKSRVVAK